MKRRGSSMATALVVVALLLTLGFTAAGLSTSSLNLASRGVHALAAKNAAEAAVSQAAAELLQTPTFASEVTVQLESDATGTLTFNKAKPLHSTNNLASDSSTPGWGGTVVPGQSVHLLGRGVCGGVEHRIEAVIFLSRYPYAVASSGPVQSAGGLQVLAQGEERPGAVGSNAQIDLNGPGIELTGDLQAVGAVKLGPQVKVEGEVRAHADEVKLPSIDVSSYDTASQPGVVKMTASSISDPLTLTGYSRSDASTLRLQRGLELDNGVLYVEGNLEVDGGITGTGAVIVTGTTRVQGGAVGGSGQTALLSKGDVVLRGLPGAYQTFAGLIYTEGNLDSRYLKLNGIFLANNKNAGGSTVRLDDTVLRQRPIDGVRFGVTATTGPAPSPAQGPSGQGFGVALDGGLGAQRSAKLQLDPAQLVWDGTQWQFPTSGPVLRGFRWVVVEGGREIANLPAVDAQELYPYSAAPIRIGQLLGAVRAYIESEGLRQMQELPPPAGASPAPGASPTTTTTTTEEWSLDLSKFILEQDRLRVLIWRDV